MLLASTQAAALWCAFFFSSFFGAFPLKELSKSEQGMSLNPDLEPATVGTGPMWGSADCSSVCRNSSLPGRSDRKKAIFNFRSSSVSAQSSHSLLCLSEEGCAKEHAVPLPLSKMEKPFFVPNHAENFHCVKHAERNSLSLCCCSL